MTSVLTPPLSDFDGSDLGELNIVGKSLLLITSSCFY